MFNKITFQLIVTRKTWFKLSKIIINRECKKKHYRVVKFSFTVKQNIYFRKKFSRVIRKRASYELLSNDSIYVNRFDTFNCDFKKSNIFLKIIWKKCIYILLLPLFINWWQHYKTKFEIRPKKKFYVNKQ